jgi:hypothetical protein
MFAGRWGISLIAMAVDEVASAAGLLQPRSTRSLSLPFCAPATNVLSVTLCSGTTPRLCGWLERL